MDSMYRMLWSKHYTSILCIKKGGDQSVPSGFDCILCNLYLKTISGPQIKTGVTLTHQPLVEQQEYCSATKANTNTNLPLNNNIYTPDTVHDILRNNGGPYTA